MSSQILTLDHFRDIDVSFRGRIRFILPDFLEPVNDLQERPILVKADMWLPTDAENHNPRHLPPLANEKIQKDISERIYKAMSELDTARLTLEIPSSQLQPQTIQTAILLRHVVLETKPHGPTSFYEVWNGYNQTIAIKNIANQISQPYEKLDLIISLIEGLPDNNDGPNLQKVGTAWREYIKANNVS